MHCYGCAKKVQKHIAKMDGMRTVFFNYYYGRN
jgi:copper chaperone CopZ